MNRIFVLPGCFFFTKEQPGNSNLVFKSGSPLFAIASTQRDQGNSCFAEYQVAGGLMRNGCQFTQTDHGIQ